MRTTVTIDDDLLMQVRERARNEGVPVKQVLNYLIRTGLEQTRSQRKSVPYRCKTYSMGDPPAVSLDKALLVADAMEDEEISRKLSVRK